MSKHPLHDLIVAYAKGADVQVQYESDHAFVDCHLPNFDPCYQWRVKPELTDLDKYGVEVGDIWKMVGCGNVVVVQVLCSDNKMYKCTEQHTRFKSNLKALWFRRGVVNKL